MENLNKWIEGVTLLIDSYIIKYDGYNKHVMETKVM